MKPLPAACFLAASLAAAGVWLDAAENARLRFIAAAYADAAGVGLHLPQAIACGPAGQVVVGDTGNGRLVRFVYADKAITAAAVLKAPQVTAPIRVQLGSKGDVFALDGASRRIFRFAPEGDTAAPLALDGVPGTDPVVLKSFAIDGADRLYLLDEFSGRIIVVDAGGKFLRALPLPEDLGFASDLSVDASGVIVVLDSLKRRLYAAAADATALTAIGGDLTPVIATLPSSIDASRGIFFVAEGNGSTIIALARDGSFISRQLTQGWDEGALRYPAQTCVSDHDELWIADRDNSRVQVFQLTR